ncbi:MAG: NAD(+)/NADH kinase [Lachnospiraceae bacterium]|nr:NAD(+)/NADH kinase [Lachnospiraceae bacterium]
MRSFFIITNSVKDPGQEVTQHISSYLTERGAKAAYLIRDDQSIADRQSEETLPLDIPEDTQCILVLGGDGTLLQAARDTLGLGIPLLGVNLGTLGFLAEVEKNDIEQALDKLLADEYTSEERMLLAGHIENSSGEKVYESHALNDIVVARSGQLMVLPLQMLVNGQPLVSYLADGMIVSTPTGSTAYNLSAGGPIVSPAARLMVVTPICPHTLNTRSVILSPDDQVEILPGESKDGEESVTAKVYFDGGLPAIVSTGDRIVIRQSSLSVTLIRLNSESFLKQLHNRLK